MANSLEISKQYFDSIKNTRLTQVQKEALRLYKIGLNVLPAFWSTKIPAAFWTTCRTTRLPNDAELIQVLFSGRIGLCVLTGWISDNLVVLDCETKSRFKDMMDRLKKAKIPIYAVRSGNRKKRGGHIYLKCSSGEVRNLNNTKTIVTKEGEILTDLEIFGEPHVIITAPSIHSSGGRYTLYPGNNTIKPPSVTLAQLREIISPDLTLTTQTKQDKSEPWVDLPPYSKFTQQLIRNGSKDGSRWKDLQRAGLDLSGCARAGLLSQNKAECLFDEIDLKSSPPYSITNPDQFSKLKNYVFTASAEPPKRLAEQIAQQTGLNEAYQIAIAWCHSQTWQGRSGLSEQKTFIALAECAQKAQSGRFRASMRELSELSGLSLTTLSGRPGKDGSIARLIKKRAIIKAGTSSGKATYYRFGKSLNLFDIHDSDSDTESNHKIIPDDLNHDLLYPKGIGLTGILVYTFLCSNITQSVNVHYIAEKLNMPKSRVSNTLTKLKKLGMANNPKRGQWIGLAVDLDMMAHNLGVSGKKAQNTAYHQSERAYRVVMAIIYKRVNDRNIVNQMQFVALWAAYKDKFRRNYYPRRKKLSITSEPVRVEDFVEHKSNNCPHFVLWAAYWHRFEIYLFMGKAISDELNCVLWATYWDSFEKHYYLFNGKMPRYLKGEKPKSRLQIEKNLFEHLDRLSKKLKEINNSANPKDITENNSDKDNPNNKQSEKQNLSDTPSVSSNESLFLYCSNCGQAIAAILAKPRTCDYCKITASWQPKPPKNPAPDLPSRPQQNSMRRRPDGSNS